MLARGACRGRGQANARADVPRLVRSRSCRPLPALTLTDSAWLFCITSALGLMRRTAMVTGCVGCARGGRTAYGSVSQARTDIGRPHTAALASATQADTLAPRGTPPHALGHKHTQHGNSQWWVVPTSRVVRGSHGVGECAARMRWGSLYGRLPVLKHAAARPAQNLLRNQIKMKYIFKNDIVNINWKPIKSFPRALNT